MAFLFLPSVPLLTFLLFVSVNSLSAFAIVFLNLISDGKSRNNTLKLLKEINSSDNIYLDRVLEKSGGKSGSEADNLIDTFTGHLNSIFLDISRSTRKFNLFASDIFFSARHMSDKSVEQSRGMEAIYTQVDDFQKVLNRLDAEISRILEQLRETSEVYQGLADRSAKAAGDLVSLSEETVSASDAAKSGLSSIEKSADVIHNLMETMKNLEKSMEEMSDHTSRVSRVIDNLEDIAERTHILATNASIEAARAGKSGAGFAVIASEIRKLADHSRDSIQEVAVYLKDTSRSINENSLFWKNGVDKIRDVRNFGDEARNILGSISGKTVDLTSAMNRFHDDFTEQEQIIEESLRISASTRSGIEGFAHSLREQSRGYEIIQELVKQASLGAGDTSRAARILSQLATYLKVGGKELLYAVRKVRISKKRYLNQLGRQEERRGLLYNLEVFQGSRFIGHLGDLSESGLLLYSDENFQINGEFPARIVLPLGFVEKTDIPIFFTPRRIEMDGKSFRIGCTMKLENPGRKGEFMEILERLTVMDTDEVTEELSEDLEELDPEEL